MNTESKKYKAVVIGCGAIGALLESDPLRPKPATHAGAFSANTKTELKALVDVNEKNLEEAGKLFPVAKKYTDSKECLLAELPDIVAIGTHQSTHKALIEECINTGVKMIICEKPLSTNPDEAEEIGRLVEKSGVTLVLNYQRRFFPLFHQVREAISSGEFGFIEQVTCYYSNGLYNNGGHIIDAVLFLLKDSISSVSCVLNTKNETHPGGDINVDGFLTSSRGTAIALQSFDQNHYGIVEIRIYGTRAACVLSEYGYQLEYLLPSPSVFGGVKQIFPVSEKRALQRISMVKGALSHAIECFEKGESPKSNPETGIETMKILDSLRKSSEQDGVRVEI